MESKTTRTKRDNETYEEKLRDPIYSKVLSKNGEGIPNRASTSGGCEQREPYEAAACVRR